MFSRIAKVLLRAVGWVLTPLVMLCAAAIGATVGLLVAPIFSPVAGLALTAGFALAAVILVLVLWLRLLRKHPELRERLAVTAEGIPDAEIVNSIVHPAE